MDNICEICGSDLITIEERQEQLCEQCIWDREFWTDYRAFCADWDAKRKVEDAARYREWLKTHPEEAQQIAEAHRG